MVSDRERAKRWVQDQPWFGLLTTPGSNTVLIDSLAAEFAAVRVAEREACAKVADEEELIQYEKETEAGRNKMWNEEDRRSAKKFTAGDIAAAIRARGEKGDGH